MEECRPAGDHPSDVRVWTFIIVGGREMHLQLAPGRLGPGHDHNGRWSVWKMVGTEEEARAAESLLTGPLVGARVILTTEIEDEEMLAIRRQGSD